jgi:hypothetical protein
MYRLYLEFDICQKKLNAIFESDKKIIYLMDLSINIGSL